MIDRAGATGTSRDLFGEVAAKPRRHPAAFPFRLVPSELASARALCAQLRRKPPLPDKQRIAHLISLNLIAILKHGAKR